MPNNENKLDHNGPTEQQQQQDSPNKAVHFSAQEFIPTTDPTEDNLSTTPSNPAVAALPSIPIPTVDDSAVKNTRKHLPRAPTPLPKEFGRMFNGWKDDNGDDEDDGGCDDDGCDMGDFQRLEEEAAQNASFNASLILSDNKSSPVTQSSSQSSDKTPVKESTTDHHPQIDA